MVLPRRDVTTTGVDPPPICLLCGMAIPWLYDPGLRISLSGSQLLKESQWRKIYWRSKLKHVMVPSHEVEEAYLSNLPQLWACFCRASEFSTEPNAKYRLTGINMLRRQGSGPYYTPKDPTMARIGGRERARYDNETFTPFYAASIGRQPSQYKGEVIGYVIHAHCWSLFGRVEGLKLNEATLAKLIPSCRRYWRNNNSWGILEDEDLPFEQHRSKFKYDCIYHNPLVVYQNPLVVPAVQEAIDGASIKSRRVPSTGRRRLSSRFSYLPLDVAILVAEWVCPVNYTADDVKDTRNMLLVFEWKLPDWFWRGRLNKHFFVELDRIMKASSPVNWQLRLDLMSLVFDPTWFPSSGLANRERVLGIMLALEKAYLEQVKGKVKKPALKN